MKNIFTDLFYLGMNNSYNKEAASLFSSNIDEFYLKAKDSVEESKDMIDAKVRSNLVTPNKENCNFLLKKTSDLVAQKDVYYFYNPS